MSWSVIQWNLVIVWNIKDFVACVRMVNHYCSAVRLNHKHAVSIQHVQKTTFVMWQRKIQNRSVVPIRVYQLIYAWYNFTHVNVLSASFCLMPRDIGPCNQEITKYGYNKINGECQKFVFVLSKIYQMHKIIDYLFADSVVVMQIWIISIHLKNAQKCAVTKATSGLFNCIYYHLLSIALSFAIIVVFYLSLTDNISFIKWSA
jgi:uncharacterized membrane protein YhdT